MKKSLNYLMVTMVVVSLFACKKEKKIVPATGLTLSQKSASTYVGGKYTLQATINPANTSDKITWSSNDPSVATVDQSGVVTGVAAGSVIITAKINNLSVTATVSVTKWTAYNVANSGLASNNVFALVIDKQGIKWIGTDKGVSKYDGIGWTTYNTANSGLPDNTIRAIAIDARGNKWFVTGNSKIAEFDGTKWSTFDSVKTNLHYNSVRCVTVDKQGNKWFGTAYEGILKFDGTTWTHYSHNDLTNNFVVNAANVDLQGNLWFGLNFFGITWKFDGTNWTTYSSSTGGWLGNSAYAITPDNKGNLWFGYSIDGATIVNFDGANFKNYYAPNEMQTLGLGVQSIAVDAQNNKWFGTWGGGVTVFDDTNWTTYNTANSGLRSSVVNAIAIDTLGNKWFGTYNDNRPTDIGGVYVLFAQ